MREITLAAGQAAAQIVVEETAYEGVRRIAEISADDFERVTGVRPKVGQGLPAEADAVICYATVGRSPLLEELEAGGKVDTQTVRGKREVYGIRIVENPWENIKRALVIYGSDKRGTIYGIFHLSEEIGVSPLVFWGDAKPVRRDEIRLGEAQEMVSKEPSVRYRGFFINDEWPCFGNWAFHHYGGFTAEMYQHVFELLLRLKGNYLWPAMWTSSFAIDGPGDANAKLADTYGVIMGNSHHEPCLRAGEEWDLYKGEHTPYGTEWNYVTNKEGLLAFWRDGLKRSGGYESIITVGMRGERDSVMQGPDSLEANIEVLKDIIANQQELIGRYVDTEERKAPRLLAVYKEVERYFFGDGKVPGLRCWDGLDDIILMLCEDNFGNMRILPDEEMRKHKGGYGMYYHLDYHGGPISYEWVNSTPLSKIWEQMTSAYEHGVREVWIVNVGDLKGNEFPLSYFLDLAYDYDTWGISAVNSTGEYTERWMRRQLGTVVTEEQVAELSEILTECVRLNSLRRPEALDSHTYHPFCDREAERMITSVKKLCRRAGAVRKLLPKEALPACESMIFYPLKSSMNLLLMQLYAGKNEHYARQGKVVANDYRDLVTRAIENDREYAAWFREAFDGKWKGMELESHIGFRKWNEDGCRYPLRMTVEPFSHPRMVVSRSDEERIAVKNYGAPEKITVDDFCCPGCEYVELEAANDGTGTFVCTVEAEKDCDWLSLSWSRRTVEKQEILRITCREAERPVEEQIHRFYLSDGDARVEVEVHAKKYDTENLPAMTFVGARGVTAIGAEHFAELTPAGEAKWRVLEGYGKAACGLKAFPVHVSHRAGAGPVAEYRVAVEEAGRYHLEVWCAPSNPLTFGGRCRFGLSVNGGAVQGIATVSADYCAGEPEDEEWSKGVLEQVHKSIIPVSLHEGVNQLKIYAMDAGVVLEKLLIYRYTSRRPVSYLGPTESFYKRET